MSQYAFGVGVGCNVKMTRDQETQHKLQHLRARRGSGSGVSLKGRLVPFDLQIIMKHVIIVEVNLILGGLFIISMTSGGVRWSPISF